MPRERKMVQVYMDSLDPAGFDRVLGDVELMDEIQLLRLHCKLNARLQKIDMRRRLQQFVEGEPEVRPDTMRPPSSMPPEAIELE